MQRDAKGRFAEATNQSATKADQRETTPSTELPAADEGVGVRSRQTAPEIPDTVPRSAESWSNLGTPVPGRVDVDQKADSGKAVDEGKEEEEYDDSLQVNRNLLDQLAQARLETDRLKESIGEHNSGSGSELESAGEEASAAEKRRKMRALRRKALLEQAEQEQSEEGSNPGSLSSLSESDESEDSSYDGNSVRNTA